MINIENSAGLAKCAIRIEIIAITNYYQTVGSQGLLFSYNRYYDIFAAIVYVSIIFVK